MAEGDNDAGGAARVLVLTADPARGGLGRAAVAAAAGALARAGARCGPADWLAPAACELPFGGLAPAAAAEAARAALGADPVDANVVAAAGRRKAVLVADMDSTIVAGETLDALAAHAGLEAEVAAITRRTMAGELDFAPALRERVAMLRGLSEDVLAETLERVALTPGARTLVATMRAAGARTALVTGGFTAIAEPVAARCGFDEVVANRLEVAGGRLTGRVVEPVVGGEAKLATLKRLAGAAGLAPAAACAVGDGANDAAMLAAAGLGVAFRAKPVVRRRASVRIEHADLAALLHLQGYRADDVRG